MKKCENQLALLRTTARGRRQLMASKSFVMIMAVVLITLLLYGINAVISMCFYNPINLKVRFKVFICTMAVRLSLV